MPERRWGGEEGVEQQGDFPPRPDTDDNNVVLMGTSHDRVGRGGGSLV